VSDTGSSRQEAQPATVPATVLYSHYPYLTVGNLHKIPHQDVNYLEAQGCLHVPTRPMLDNFVEQYFTHVHVLLPLLNEGDFWDMYAQHGINTPSQDKMTLLVFQSMLFACCNVRQRESRALIPPASRSCLG